MDLMRLMKNVVSKDSRDSKAQDAVVKKGNGNVKEQNDVSQSLPTVMVKLIVIMELGQKLV
jgi:hypothetical protein